MRKFVCAVVALVLAVSVSLAEEVKGKFVKADDKSITVSVGKKGEEKETTYTLAKDVKVTVSDAIKDVKTLSSAKAADVKGQITVVTKKEGDKEVVIEIKGAAKPKPE